MVKKTLEDRLFGAACVYVMLENSGHSPEKNQLYLGTLEDLELEPSQVEEYLSSNRGAVERSLKQVRASKTNAAR